MKKKITIALGAALALSLTIGAVALAATSFTSDSPEAAQEQHAATQAAEVLTVSTANTSEDAPATSTRNRGKMPDGFNFSPEMMRSFGNMRLPDGFTLPFDLPDMSKYEDMTDEERAAAMRTDAEAILQDLIVSGFITQEQADKMLESFDMVPEAGFNFRGRSAEWFDFPFEMPDMSKYESMTDEEKAAAIRSDLERMFSAAFGDIELPDFSKYEGMTNEERAAALKEAAEAILSQLIAGDVITQEQADMLLEMIDLIPEAKLGFGERHDEGLQPPFSSGRRDREGFEFPFEMPDMSNYEGMTDDERTAAMKADFAIMLDALVAEGAITQEQADRINDLFDKFPAGFDRSSRAASGNRTRFDGMSLDGFLSAGV